MAITSIAVTDDISTCEAFDLSGGARIKADDLQGDDKVILYGQRVDGAYEPEMDGGAPIVLTKQQPSAVVYSFGSFKCLGSKTGIGVGYAS